MTRVRTLLVICCAVAALAVPQAALAAGPVTTPKTLLTEGFESTTATTYVTSPYVAGGLTPGYWGRVAAPKVVNPAHGGAWSLWCDGTNATVLSRTVIRYAIGSQGFATFNLTQTVDYYKPVASFYYAFPSAGYSDSEAFAPEWAATGVLGVSSALYAVSYPTTNTWTPMSIDLSSQTTSPTRLSRAAGMFQFRWRDVSEPPGHSGSEVGQGVSIDDVTIAGWRFGPVRSLSATATSTSARLTWSRPWRSTAATSTEERPLAYRVWRAPQGSTSWIELTPAVRVASPGTAVTFSDTTVAAGTAYTYAVQAWEPGTGDATTAGYGEHVAVNATTKRGPSVAVTTPLANAVVVGTGASAIAGTVQAFDGATVSSVMMMITREDGRYFNNTTGLWTTTPTTFAAVVAGTSWSSAWIPEAGDYLTHTYTIKATATDSRDNTTSSAVTVKADSVPYIAPVSTITAPAAASLLKTTGPIVVSGSATVQTGLPAATVHVSLEHGGTWWNGSTWTATQAWVPATVVGAAWTLSGVMPPANEYGTPSYVATARATDAHLKIGTSGTRTFTVDSVPFVAPTVGVAFPENNVDVIGEGPYTLRGTVAAVHPNLPLKTNSVRVFIKRDTAGLIRWWNGSTWVSSETSVAAIGTSNWTYSWQPPASEYHESTFTVRATALDDHGLLGSSANSVFKVNSMVPNPPDVYVTVPSLALTSRVGTLAVSGTAAGRDGAVVQRVSLHIGRSSAATGVPTTWWNGTTWSGSETSDTYVEATYSAGAPTWSYDWKLPTDEYAAHTYVVRAYGHDNRAQIGTSTPVSTQLDTVPWTPPAVSISTTASPDLVGTGAFTISGTVTPVRATLPLAANSVRVTIARDTAGTVTWWNGSTWSSSETSVAAVGTATWSYSWMPPANEYRKSTFSVRAAAVDAHGLTGTSATRTFKVDSVPMDPPTTSIHPPLPNPAPAAPITVTGIAALAATVEGSPITLASVYVKIEAKSSAGTKTWWNGTGWQSTTTSVRANGTKAWTTTFTSKPNDSRSYVYTIISTATDTHGLSGSSVPVVTISADTVGPKIVSARSIGRYAVEVRFSEKPYAPAGAGRIDARYFSSRGLALRKIIGWSKDGTRVRIMTSRQTVVHGTYRVTLRKRVVDALGN